MRLSISLVGSLLGLCLLGLTTTRFERVGWMLFLVVVPAVLAGLLWAGWRWAAMACVIYGTIGFALDLATGVQSLTKDHAAIETLAASAISGLLNFLLIVFGGRSFFESFQGPPPPGSHPPNPPSPASSATT